MPTPRQADPRQHRGAAQCRDQDQGFHRGLQFRRLVLRFRKLRDVVPASWSVTSSRPRGSGIGSSKRRCHPFSGISANLLSADPVERRAPRGARPSSPVRRTEVNLTDQGYCAHRLAGSRKPALVSIGGS
jgi:hypothetical protein